MDKYLRSLSTAKFILIMVFISYLVVIPVVLMGFLMNIHVGGPEFEDIPLALMILIVVVIAPIWETLVYQLLIIRQLKKLIFFKRRSSLTILISALVFGAVHIYSIYYMFYAFIIGLLFAYTFVIYEDKKASAFWVTMAIHGLKNGIAMLITDIELLYQLIN
ncbi:MAG: CPBP family intramembrane metalloprotease [Vallitaleaceae bacterium]|nr:CPBP family intramembrane metalloprotease [Vallitaleaceae bacterium]